MTILVNPSDNFVLSVSTNLPILVTFAYYLGNSGISIVGMAIAYISVSQQSRWVRRIKDEINRRLDTFRNSLRRMACCDIYLFTAAVVRESDIGRELDRHRFGLLCLIPIP